MYPDKKVLLFGTKGTKENVAIFRHFLLIVKVLDASAEGAILGYFARTQHTTFSNSFGAHED